MTAVRKFEYTVDPSHTLISKAATVTTWLDSLCPVLVGKLRAEAEKQSSSRLFTALERFSTNALIANALGLREEAAEARLFVAISLDTLSRRYFDGTLEPELHAGDKSSVAWAKEQIQREDAEQEAVSTVNATSDGIA